MATGQFFAVLGCVSLQVRQIGGWVTGFERCKAEDVTGGRDRWWSGCDQHERRRQISKDEDRQSEQADEEKIHVERACARHDAGKPSVAQMTGCRITASAISPGLRNANAASRCASRASLVASGVSGASAGSSGGIGCSRTANRVRTAATNQDQVCTLYQDGAIVRLPGNLRTGKTCQIRQFLAAIDRLAVNMAGSPETPPLPTVAKPHPDYFCTPGRIHPSRARANRGILPSL